VTAVRVGLALEAAHRREDAAVPEIPLLDLVVVALDVGAEGRQVGAQPLLDRREPVLARIPGGIDPAADEQVVVDLLQADRVEVALRLGPVGRLARFQRDQLDEQSGLLGAGERRLRGRAVVVLAFERVLELVLRQRRRLVGLAVVALGGQVELRLALLVLGEPGVHDLPADRRAVLESAERVPDRRRVVPIAPEGAELLVPVRVPQPQPIARRLQRDARPVHALHEPVAPFVADDGPRDERLLARVRVHALVPRTADVHELVTGRHARSLRA